MIQKQSLQFLHNCTKPSRIINVVPEIKMSFIEKYDFSVEMLIFSKAIFRPFSESDHLQSLNLHVLISRLSEKCQNTLSESTGRTRAQFLLSNKDCECVSQIDPKTALKALYFCRIYFVKQKAQNYGKKFIIFHNFLKAQIDPFRIFLIFNQ